MQEKIIKKSDFYAGNCIFTLNWPYFEVDWILEITCGRQNFFDRMAKNQFAKAFRYKYIKPFGCTNVMDNQSGSWFFTR